MKTLRGHRDVLRIESSSWKISGRSAVVLVFLLLLLSLVAGCAHLDEETAASQSAEFESLATATAPAESTTTSAAPESTTTSVTESVASTTALPESTTTLPASTTMVESTTTMVAETATTIPESVIASELLQAADPTGMTTEQTDQGELQGQPEQTAQTKTVLYEITDWSEGTCGWAAAGQWQTVAGMLVTDGSSDSFAVAPVDLTGQPDYVVECEVQFVDPKAETDVFLMVRMINGLGYWAGFDASETRMVIGYGAEDLGDAHFVLDGNWHTYRLEIRGNALKLFFEQAEVARAMDNRALEAGTVGIYCGNGQINVRSFRVVALD